MDLNELWLYAVNYALDSIQGSQREKFILELLKDADGNVSKALKLSTQIRPGWYESYAELMGNFGTSGPDSPRVNCGGSAGSASLEAWLPGSKISFQPDLIIPWREVFEYVKAGRKRNVQMSLF